MKYLAAILCTLALTATGAIADKEVERCFRLTPYSDIISLTGAEADDAQSLMFGVWAFPGGYSIPVVAAKNYRRFSIMGANPHPLYFGGNTACTITAQVGGPYRIVCTGAKNPYVLRSGAGVHFVRTKCVDDDAAVHTGRPAGG